MRVGKPHIVLTVFLLLICSTVSESDVSASELHRLQVFLGPSRVLADSGVYNAISVQLRDSRGRPVRASEDVTVSLSSSLTDVGSIDPMVTIRSGETYAVARFFSTYTAGSTTITAIASGYTSGQAVMTTYGPIPSRIAIYAAPPAVPADGLAYESIIIQLQDPSGKPARAPIGDVEVTLASSDITVGTVNTSVIIRSGRTYAVTKFYTTYKAGSTEITAIAPGYTSGQATVRTSGIGGAPSKLKVYSGPPRVSAEGISFESIYVQLEDSQGKIAKAPNETRVTLASSDISVGTVDSSVTIRSNRTYAVTKFYTTYKAGSTEITAIAPGYTSGQAVMTTYGPIPSRIAIYAAPPAVPADGLAYESIIIQLQDSAGSPARDPIGDAIVILSSSNTDIGNVNQTACIVFGGTHTVTKFHSGYKTGSTTITAVASGYTSGKVSMATYAIDPLLTVSVSAYPDSVGSGREATIRVYVARDSLEPAPPIPGATIELTSDGGGEFSPVIDEKNGYYSTVYAAPTVDDQMVCNITAVASKRGYVRGEAEVKVTVSSGGNILIQAGSSDGNPIVGATVLSTFQPSGQLPLNAETNGEGIVEFRNLADGSYEFSVEKQGFDKSVIRISVEAGQKKRENIVLSPTAFWMLKHGWLLLLAVLLAPVVSAATIFAVMRSRKKKLLNPRRSHTL